MVEADAALLEARDRPCRGVHCGALTINDSESHGKSGSQGWENKGKPKGNQSKSKCLGMDPHVTVKGQSQPKIGADIRPFDSLLGFGYTLIPCFDYDSFVIATVLL